MLKIRKQMYLWIWGGLKTGEHITYNLGLVNVKIWLKWTIF